MNTIDRMVDTRRRVLGAAVAGIIVTTSFSGVARSAPSEGVADVTAEATRDEAREAFSNGEFDEAIRLFEEAHDQDGEPTDLFNLGRVYEELGDLERALDYYEEFVQQPRLRLDERKAATDRIEVLRVAVAPTPPAPTVSPVVSAPAPTPTTADRPPDGRGLIITGAVMSAAGAALAVGAGVGFGVRARRASDRVGAISEGSNPDRLSLSEAEDLDAQGKDAETLQISLAVAGGAVAAAGIALLAVGGLRYRKSRQQAFAPAVGPRFAGMRATWRF